MILLHYGTSCSEGRGDGGVEVMLLYVEFPDVDLSRVTLLGANTVSSSFTR